MPTVRLIEVKTYFDPEEGLFQWMEQERGKMRRKSRSMFIQDIIFEHHQRQLKKRPVRDDHRRVAV